MADVSEHQIFEERAPALFGLAYRMLGSRADAEDAVQDTFVNWQRTDRAAIDNPAAWLTAACTRRCIDLLRAAHRSRVDYVGAWLPDPLPTPEDENPEERAALASSLSTAFLLLLERLTPRERAAYLLHEIFEMAYPDVARTLEMGEAACRKLVSRARAGIGAGQVRHPTPVERQHELLGAFEAAIGGGGIDRLAALLSEDIALAADGGGKVPTILAPIEGKAAVLAFVTESLRRFWAGYEWVAANINGGKGVVLRKDGSIAAAVTFAYDAAGRATGIYIMRNPDKLAGLSV